MIKSELIRLVAAKMTHLPEQLVAEAIDGILLCMSETLVAGKHIEIRGFGSFAIKEARPRQARNPKTGERILTRAKPKIHFKPGLELSERVTASKERITLKTTRTKKQTKEETNNE